MSNERKYFRDRFTFSLRGMTATASYFIAPVIADDRITRARDEAISRRRQKSVGALGSRIVSIAEG